MSNKKYVIYLGGGMANKMFQLAFAYSLFKKGQEVLFDDFSFRKEFEHEDLDIKNIFPNIKFERMPIGMYHYSCDNGIRNKFLRRIPLFTGENYYISHSDGYDPNFLTKIKKRGYIIGTFQNEQYFSVYRDEILDMFSFRHFQDTKNLEREEKMTSCNSVSIHIRKGDGYATWKQFKGTCDVDYYKRAINYIKEREENLRFFVFTDTPKWVTDNFSWLEYDLIEDNPISGEGSHFDMQLMSKCKHNIIANSTYSWWGAWLNKNENKIVIGPKEWFAHSYYRERDIIPDNWIKL